MKKILIVSNDYSNSSKIYNLLKTNFDTFFMEDLNRAIEAATHSDYDAFFIDIAEGAIGFDFIRSLKKNNVSTSQFFAIDDQKILKAKIEALSLGVKDIFSSDMHQDEVILRMKNHFESREFGTNRYKDLKVELATLSAFCGKQKLDLTLIEFKLLLFLIRRAGEIVGRDDLKHFTWPNSAVQDKTINTHLTNLRLKLGSTAVKVKSIKGEGVILV